MPATVIKEGTINLTNGSKVVTGNSTNWGLTGVRSGDTLLDVASGLTTNIDDVTSDTDATLIADWAGTTGTNLSFIIIPRGDESRTAENNTLLRKLLASINMGGAEYTILEAQSQDLSEEPYIFISDPSIESFFKIDQLITSPDDNGVTTIIDNNGTKFRRLSMGAGNLLASSNLDDLVDKADARTNLGLDAITRTDQQVIDLAGIHDHNTHHTVIDNPLGTFDSFGGVGAIKVTIPGYYTDNDFLFIEMAIHANGATSKLIVTGYATSTTTTWENTQASLFGKMPTYTVRFGDDGTNTCIWIGGVTDTWANCSVTIESVVRKFSTTPADVNRLKSGWEVSLVSTFNNIISTVINIGHPEEIRKVNSVDDMATFTDPEEVDLVELTDGYRSGKFKRTLYNLLTFEQKVAVDLDNVNQRGVYIKNGIYVYYRELFTGPLLVHWFGADPSRTNDSTVNIQDAINISESFTSSPCGVHLGCGRYLTSATLNLNVLGSKLSGDGCRQSVIIPTISDGTPVINVANSVDYITIENLSITGSVDESGFDAGTADSANAIGIQAVQDVSGNPSRALLRNLFIYGTKVGLDLSGWLYSIDNVLCFRTELGARLDLVNASVFDGLKIEASRKYFELTNSDGVTFDGLVGEGAVALQTASTIDDCSGVTISSPYFESNAVSKRTEPFLKVGSIAECHNISLINCSVAGSGGIVDGVYPIEIDIVKFGEFSGHVSEGGQRHIVKTTQNTRHFDTSKTSSRLSGFLQDDSKCHSPVLNYFPNGNFSGGVRGYEFVYNTKCVISTETVNTRIGQQAVRITATADNGPNDLYIRYVGEPVIELRGKKVRLGAWVYIPDIPAFQVPTRTALAGFLISSNNGTDTVTSSTKNSNFVAGAWNYFSYEVDIQSDATNIVVRFYINHSPNATDGSEYIIIDAVTLCEENTMLQHQMGGLTTDAECLPSFANGKMISYEDAKPADSRQNYLAGDQVFNTTQTAGSSMGWVCTASGTGTTSTWALMPILGAAA